jgi:HJR/Mrr/RecB family endonuclease
MHFLHKIEEDVICFRLEDNKSYAPLTTWKNIGHPAALSAFVFFVDNGIISIDEDAVELRLSHDQFMDWVDGQERHLQKIASLPALFDGSLLIESEGTFHQSTFSVKYSWQKPSGRQRYAAVKENGCFITVAGEVRLLSRHAWELRNAVLGLQKKLASINNDVTDRMLEWYEVQKILDLLPEEERVRAVESSALQSVKLSYANAFQLEALPQDDGYDIIPILLQQKVKEIEDSSVEHESLLSPVEQEKYAAFFCKAKSIPLCMSLDVGRYVILNKDVQKVLQYVQSVRQQTAQDRLEFLKNPRAALSNKFEDEISEETFGEILSDRVVGIGAWQAKIVPYVQIKGQDWLPDGALPEGKRGISVGDKNIAIETEDEARAVIDLCQSAISSGKASFVWSGEELPATSQLINAVNDLYPRRPDIRNADECNFDVEEPQDRNVLIIKENFNDVKYQVLRVPRHIKLATGMPEQLRTLPKPHQEVGFDWLCRHYAAGSRGVLLADDMGLGKTWQALAFLAWLKQGMDSKKIPRLPLLIIAPTGLLKNWENEINVHLKDGLGEIARIYGAGAKDYRRGAYLDTVKLKDADVVLTTYETLNRYQISFTAIKFAIVIFDEMQKVKNPASQITNAVNTLRADFWVGMTGTPVENRLADIWCISDILQPGWLGSIKDFSQFFEKPLLETPPSYTQLEELKKIIATPSDNAPEFMLRRMKSDTLSGLPMKHEHLLEEFMSDEQADFYQQIVSEAKGSDERGAMLQALHRMRAVSLHPDYQKVLDYKTDRDFIKRSARLKKTFSILEGARQKNEKVLIFIEYDAWHQADFFPSLLKKYFELPELPMTINGSVKGELRQARVEKFQAAEGIFDIMLLSPKAGGVGLTLTAANHVIHLTRWWNPAVEDQATDRVYRIGQKKDVHVYYPISIHPVFQLQSFDKCLHNLLENKRRLSRDVLLPAGEMGDEWRGLFTQTVKDSTEDRVSMQEIAVFSPLQFEEYILQRLQKALNNYGLHVRKTPKSWDGGADMVVENATGNIVALVQCKHSASTGTVTSGSGDIRRAMANYDVYQGVVGVAITNVQASKADHDWCTENPDTRVLLEKEDCLMPELKVADVILRQNAYLR